MSLSKVFSFSLLLGCSVLTFFNFVSSVQAMGNEENKEPSIHNKRKIDPWENNEFENDENVLARGKKPKLNPEEEDKKLYRFQEQIIHLANLFIRDAKERPDNENRLVDPSDEEKTISYLKKLIKNEKIDGPYKGQFTKILNTILTLYTEQLWNSEYHYILKILLLNRPESRDLFIKIIQNNDDRYHFEYTLDFIAPFDEPEFPYTKEDYEILVALKETKGYHLSDPDSICFIQEIIRGLESEGQDAKKFQALLDGPSNLELNIQSILSQGTIELENKWEYFLSASLLNKIDTLLKNSNSSAQDTMNYEFLPEYPELTPLIKELLNAKWQYTTWVRRILDATTFEEETNPSNQKNPTIIKENEENEAEEQKKAKTRYFDHIEHTRIPYPYITEGSPLPSEEAKDLERFLSEEAWKGIARMVLSKEETVCKRNQQVTFMRMIFHYLDEKFPPDFDTKARNFLHDGLKKNSQNNCPFQTIKTFQKAVENFKKDNPGSAWNLIGIMINFFKDLHATYKGSAITGKDDKEKWEKFFANHDQEFMFKFGLTKEIKKSSEKA